MTEINGHLVSEGVKHSRFQLPETPSKTIPNQKLLRSCLWCIVLGEQQLNCMCQTECVLMSHYGMKYLYFDLIDLLVFNLKK